MYVWGRKRTKKKMEWGESTEILLWTVRNGSTDYTIPQIESVNVFNNSSQLFIKNVTHFHLTTGDMIILNKGSSNFGSVLFCIFNFIIKLFVAFYQVWIAVCWAGDEQRGAGHRQLWRFSNYYGRGFPQVGNIGQVTVFLSLKVIFLSGITEN